MLKLSSAVLNRRVFKQGSYEKHSKNMMLSKTPRYLTKDINVIDVGAAVGMYSYFFSLFSKKVFAYEAVPPIYKQLEKTASKRDNIITHNLAISNFTGISEFFVDDKRLSNNSFQNLVDGQKIEIEVDTIDHQFASDLDVGFIKIDTEGTELDVLNGAINTIDKYKPTCMVEIYYKFNKYPLETTFEFFFDRQYKCYYHEVKKDLVEIKSIKEGVEIASNPDMIKVHDGDFLFAYSS